jgi:hypothetical protein
VSRFIRTAAGPGQLGFVRGPAMLYTAPMTQAPPATISDVLKITGSETNEVQSIAITGTPTGGTFTLTFQGRSTAAIAYNATSTAVAAALNAVLEGNVTTTGGPLPGTPVAITFVSALGNQDVGLLTATSALTGGTTPAINITVSTPGQGLYDPQGLWTTPGGTKNGVNSVMNNDEETFTIDQQLTPIATQPSTWTWTIATSLAEVTMENLALAWDMGPVTVNATPATPEKRVGMGAPLAYTQRRVAIVHRRVSGLLRMHFFYQCSRNPAETTLGYQATGDQQSVPFNMTAYADDYVSDQYSNVGFILDQVG